MATTILPTAADKDAYGDEFTVVAGLPAGICMIAVDGTALVVAVKKDPAGTFQPTGIALTADAPDGTLVAPGVYKLQRKRGNCGAFRD